MWMITPIGFFSGVADKRDRNTIVVRARKHSHLVALRKRVPGASKIRTGEGTDYPYRVTVTVAEWARFAADMAMETTEYTNFKDSVRDKDDHDVYLRVWGALRSLTPRRVRDRERERLDREYVERYGRRRGRRHRPAGQRSFYDLSWAGHELDAAFDPEER